MSQKDYRSLIVWQKAMDLVDFYRATRSFPKEELYGLTSQVRRAVVSIPSNIAEGQGRGRPKEFANFLVIAHGSLREVETQLTIAFRLTYLDEELLTKLLALAAEVGRLINVLLNHPSR